MKVIVQAAPFFNLLSKQWTVPILYRLSEDGTYFNELKRDLSGISAKVLSERLRELELWGFLVRKDEGNKVHYSLSKVGGELHGNLKYLDDWLVSWFTAPPKL